jgi:hypothetical protein
MARNSTTNTAAGITLLAGIWLVIAPFVMNYSQYGISSTNSVVLGIVIGVLALVRMSGSNQVWASWLNLIAGLWMIISPFALGYSNISAVVTNDIVVGLIVGVSALTSAFSSSSIESPGGI